MNNYRNPLIPMGAITGNLSREQIHVMLRRYADAGITQFLIYPRDGCDVPYMSERWLEICGDIIEYAAKLGMEIWLYDEFNWPSGTCCGEVMKENPEYQVKHVAITGKDCEIKYDSNYADILNPDAVDCFIRLTHEKYHERFGSYFGQTIKGIFTDEPSFIYYSGDGFPYFSNAEKYYAEATGRDLFTDMIDKSKEFYRDYYALLGKQFAEVFIGRISEWCREHDILLTGHLMADDSLDGWVRVSGNAMKALRGFSVPGIDDITTNSMENWQLAGYEQAAVRACGHGGLAELFAFGPTDIPPARVEQQIWYMAMFGVDHYVLAVAAADARGNVKKNGWYNPMNYSSPWFKGYPELGLSAAKAASFARKTIDVDVCVRVPISEYSFSIPDKTASAQIHERFSELLRSLTKEQYQWILLDEDEPTPEGKILLDVTKSDVRTLISSLKEKRPLAVRITDPVGKLPEHLLVRRYTDGSSVVLDLIDSEDGRELVLDSGDTKVPFYLCGRGHWCVGSEAPQKTELMRKLSPEFRLLPDRPNTLRANFNTVRNEFEFTAAEELDGIRLLVRNYLPGGELSLDGIKLKAESQVNALSPGFGDLYLSTEPFTLMPGRHILRITKTAQSEPFLPSCFVCGNFAASTIDSKDVLRALPEKVGIGLLDRDILCQYAGCIAYETMLDIPEEDWMLALGSSGLYTRVIMNGIELGGKLSGYVWEYPSEFRGTSVLLRIEQYTSIGPIFGRAEDVISVGDGKKWANLSTWFPRKYQHCGIEWIGFVKQSQPDR